jgi:phosphoribosyl 1,2-cyclic phosphodiesterase
MELKILGSSSSGNCYVLDNGKEALVIEAGVHLVEVKKAVGFNSWNVTGVLISHEHGDHAKYVRGCLDNQWPVYASKGTVKALSLWHSLVHIVEPQETYRPSNGGFEVIPFGVLHDAADPLGFLIRHPETGTVLFATDTSYLPNTFAGLNNVLIECNYRQDLLDADTKCSKARRDRVIASHMSYDTCRETLLANNLRGVNNIVLIHLSDDHSNERDFVEGIHHATRKHVTAASRGMKLRFNKTPF